jgi:hypothetical protein
MDMFYTLVLAIAIVFLIIVLTVVALSIKSAIKNQAYPPFQNSCPDYWNASEVEGDNAVCGINPINVGKLGTDLKLTNTPSEDPSMVYTPGWDATANTIDFGDSGWTSGFSGMTPACAQKQWATVNGIQWDGITNSNMSC